jgi:hypothetical protein
LSYVDKSSFERRRGIPSWHSPDFQSLLSIHVDSLLSRCAGIATKPWHHFQMYIVMEDSGSLSDAILAPALDV